MRVIISVFTGLAASFFGIALHNFLPPFGLALSIVVIYQSISLLGKAYQSRPLKVVAALSFLALLVRASTHGRSFEILVVGNTMGNAYTALGAAVVIYAVVRREWKSSVTSQL